MFFNSGRIFRTDYVSLVTAILYVFIFRFIYTDYLVPLWGYFGYYNNNSDGIRIITSNIFAVLPILCYSNKKVISNLISIFIYFYSFMRPGFRDFYFDDTTEYQVEIIDTWEMTVTDGGIHKGKFRVKLPGKEYMAVRLQIAK